MNSYAPLLAAFIVFSVSCASAEIFFPKNTYLGNGVERCFEEAAERYNVNQNLLLAIGITESSLLSDAVNSNVGSGSIDVGIMQINSFWWPLIAEHGISPENLLDPCININVGAWILADSINRFGDNWRAVGAYNAGTAKTKKAELKRSEYVDKVYRNYISLVE